MNNRIFLLIPFLVGCVSKQTSKETNENNNSSKTTLVAKSSLAIPDSLYDYRSYYYLSNISTKDFAELYLKDSIITNDYKKLTKGL